MTKIVPKRKNFQFRKWLQHSRFPSAISAKANGGFDDTMLNHKQGQQSRCRNNNVIKFKWNLITRNWWLLGDVWSFVGMEIWGSWSEFKLVSHRHQGLDPLTNLVTYCKQENMKLSQSLLTKALAVIDLLLVPTPNLNYKRLSQPYNYTAYAYSEIIQKAKERKEIHSRGKRAQLNGRVCVIVLKCY